MKFTKVAKEMEIDTELVCFLWLINESGKKSTRTNQSL